MRLWLFLAALNGLVAVSADAYGWHLLVAEDPLREMFNMAVRYQMWHALALLAVAWLFERAPTPARIAGWSFTAGIVLFCGVLYALALTGAVPVTGAAPIGGGLLMAGWAAFGWGALAAR